MAATKQNKGKTKMNIDNIVAALNDLIYDAKSLEGNIFEDRVDAGRVLSSGEDEETYKATAKTYEAGLMDAQDALKRAEEAVESLRYGLERLIEEVDYEQLSSKAMEK